MTKSDKLRALILIERANWLSLKSGLARRVSHNLNSPFTAAILDFRWRIFMKRAARGRR